MNRNKLGPAVLLATLLLSFSAAQAQTVAYNAIKQTGNQTAAGNLGLDFDVVKPIRITSLGAFDSDGDGFAGLITVGIFNRDTSAPVGSPVVLTGNSDPLVGGSRLRVLGDSSFSLPAGHYSVVAVGFSSTDPSGNALLPPPFTASTLNGLGAITFVGTGRFDGNSSLQYPSIAAGGTPNVYLAGTFQFERLPLTLDAPAQIRYAANLQAGESYINIINTGFNGDPRNGPGVFGAYTGNICVNAYIFSEDEQLVSCCSCVVTPNQVVNLGIVRDVLSVRGTLTAVQPTSVTIKLIGSNANSGNCSNAAATVNAANIVGGFVAYGTTLHETRNPGAYATTETPFTPIQFNTAGTPGANDDLHSLTGRCAFILGNGGGYGICNACRVGSLSATKK